LSSEEGEKANGKNGEGGEEEEGSGEGRSRNVMRV
jgi:hypothetical protein